MISMATKTRQRHPLDEVSTLVRLKRTQTFGLNEENPQTFNLN